MRGPLRDDESVIYRNLTLNPRERMVCNKIINPQAEPLQLLSGAVFFRTAIVALRSHADNDRRRAQYHSCRTIAVLTTGKSMHYTVVRSSSRRATGINTATVGLQRHVRRPSRSGVPYGVHQPAGWALIAGGTTRQQGPRLDPAGRAGPAGRAQRIRRRRPAARCRKCVGLDLDVAIHEKATSLPGPDVMQVLVPHIGLVAGQ